MISFTRQILVWLLMVLCVSAITEGKAYSHNSPYQKETKLVRLYSGFSGEISMMLNKWLADFDQPSSRTNAEQMIVNCAKRINVKIKLETLSSCQTKDQAEKVYDRLIISAIKEVGNDTSYLPRNYYLFGLMVGILYRQAAVYRDQEPNLIISSSSQQSTKKMFEELNKTAKVIGLDAKYLSTLKTLKSRYTSAKKTGDFSGLETDLYVWFITVTAQISGVNN